MKDKSLESIEQFSKTLSKIRALEEAINVLEKDVIYKDVVKSLIDLRKEKEVELKLIEKKLT